MKSKTGINKKCLECKVSFYVSLCKIKTAKFCSNKCRGLNQSRTNKGEGNPNYRGGNSSCVDCKKELRYRYNFRTDTPRCKECNYNFAVGNNSTNWRGGVTNPECVNCSAITGDIKSVLCRNCYKGALHPFWKGGASTLQSLVRAMCENRQWIRQCMYRDRYTCQECNIESNGNNMQVHHKKQFAQVLRDNEIDSVEKARNCAELWDMENGVTLCKSCHKLTESFNRKLS